MRITGLFLDTGPPQATMAFSHSFPDSFRTGLGRENQCES